MVSTCILGSGNLDFLITPSSCTGDVTTVAYRGNLEIDLMLSSVYIPHEAASYSDDLIRLLVELSNRKRCRLILGCDANAHLSKRLWRLYQKLVNPVTSS